MIVLDVLAAVAVLLNASSEIGRIREKISHLDETLHVPRPFQIEVLHALRHHNLSGTLSAKRAHLALKRLRQTRLIRLPPCPISRPDLGTAGEPHRLDAAYIALTEGLKRPWLRWTHGWRKRRATAPRWNSTSNNP